MKPPKNSKIGTRAQIKARKSALAQDARTNRRTGRPPIAGIKDVKTETYEGNTGTVRKWSGTDIKTGNQRGGAAVIKNFSMPKGGYKQKNKLYGGGKKGPK